MKKNKNYAIIDIGSLKVKFLVAKILPDGELKQVYFSNNLTCFGVGLDENQGNVQERYLQTTIQELRRCRQLLKDFKIDGLRVVSTHAMRRAKNKDEVLERILKETGFKVEIISQEEEAKMFFKGVISGFETDKDYAIVDMGGGSVQILVGNRHELKKAHLIRSGAQYLHENFTFNPHSPDSFTREEDIEKMRRYILEQLLPLRGIGDLPLIYGSSNIIDLMKTIGIPLEENPESKTHPYRTYARYLEEFIKKVLPLTYKERETKYPFQSGYMWGIDKAFLNIVTMAECFPSSQIIPSNANLAWGLIYTLAQ
jgi:exopolyphosphatase/guanosine-5'-triphosphate,3'-diphosphate pyrophosphatase